MANNDVTWQVLQPTGDINRFRNPSMELNIDGFVAATVGTTIIRSTIHAKSGAASLYCVNPGPVNLARWYSVNTYYTTVAADYYFQFWIRGVAGQVYNIIIYDVFPGGINTTTTTTGTGDWVFVSVPFTCGATSQRYDIGANAVAGSGFYVDCIEVVSNDRCSYLDGDQPGCTWDGGVHASSSRRLSTARGGGLPLDLYNTIGFKVGAEAGSGLTAVDYLEQDRTYLPGTQTTGLKVPRRVWQISGALDGTDWENMRKRHNEFTHDVAPLTVPKINGAPQPPRWRYVGPHKTLQIDAHYAGGLDVGLTAQDCHYEQVGLRLLANDNPYWYDIWQDGDDFYYQDDPGFTSVLGRLDGVWDALACTSFTGNGIVYAVCIGQDGMVYFGGDFTQVNGNGNMAYVFQYDPLIDDVAPIAVSGVNGIVYALYPMPDGTILLGGAFTNAGGANGDYITSYDPTTDAFTPLTANPLNGIVVFISQDLYTGNILLTGDFTQDSVPTVLNRVARIVGGAFSAIGAGIDGGGKAIVGRRTGQLIVGGTHTEKLSAFDLGGAAWYEVGAGGGLSDNVYTLYLDNDDSVYVGGQFTTMDGETCLRVMRLGEISSTYVQWETLGRGINGGQVRGFARRANGDLRIVGTFGNGDVLDLRMNTAIVSWSGTTYTRPDYTEFNAAIITGVDAWCVAVAPNGNEYYGSSSLAAIETRCSGITTITLLHGASETYPVIRIWENSGAEAYYLVHLENLTTGTALSFDSMYIMPGEIITINCQNRTLTSNIGRNLSPYLLEGNLGDFYLQAGENRIALFIEDYELIADDIVTPGYWNTQYWDVSAAEDAT